MGLPGVIVVVMLITSNIFRKVPYRKKPVNEQVVPYLFEKYLNGSMITFAVGGAFLTAIYYPHLYVLCGIYEAVNRQHHTATGEIDVQKKDQVPFEFSS